MPTDHILAFLVFAFVAAATPGPSNIILASTGAAIGVRRGLPTLLGVTLGMGAMMSLVGFGLGSLLLTHPLILPALKWGGVAFLLWLAWKIAASGPSQGDATHHRVGFWEAAAFQWVNPKSWLISASAAGVYVPAAAGGALAQSVWLGVLFVAAAIPGCLIWLALGATVQRLLREQEASRRLNLVMGALLAGSIVLFIR
jgi:threonine/homoserine/homoserine lactone efflux protein